MIEPLTLDEAIEQIAELRDLEIQRDGNRLRPGGRAEAYINVLAILARVQPKEVMPNVSDSLPGSVTPEGRDSVNNAQAMQPAPAPVPNPCGRCGHDAGSHDRTTGHCVETNPKEGLCPCTGPKPFAERVTPPAGEPSEAAMGAYSRCRLFGGTEKEAVRAAYAVDRGAIEARTVREFAAWLEDRFQSEVFIWRHSGLTGSFNIHGMVKDWLAERQAKEKQ